MNDLFEKHAEKVYRFALSLSRDVHHAEDLVQETFLRAFRAEDTLQDPTRAKAWLFQILVNVWRDRQRKKKVEAGELGELDPGGTMFSPEQLAMQTEQKQLIFKAMSKLPEQQRNVLHLRTVEQFSLAEIATLLDSNVDAVKANLSVARKKMRCFVTEQITERGATK